MSFFLDKVFSSLVKQFFTAVKKTTHIQGKGMFLLQYSYLIQELYRHWDLMAPSKTSNTAFLKMITYCTNLHLILRPVHV